jgi:O-antigen/teichoic acid export membrane protein
LYTNGIYAAVTKFSQIIEIIAVVVFQAWQETSVLQLNSKDRDQYYSSILSSYLLVLTGIVISVSFVLKTAYPSLVEAQYAIGTKYLYIIFIAEIGFSLQFFMSAIFQALKNTKQTLYTTLASAVISIILNYFLIRFFSLMGAAVAFGLSYFFMFASYLIAARKYLRIGLSAKSVIFSLLLLATGGLIFYYTDNILWRIVFWITSSILIITALPKSVISDIKHYFQSFQQQTHNNRS